MIICFRKKTSWVQTYLLKKMKSSPQALVDKTYKQDVESIGLLQQPFVGIHQQLTLDMDIEPTVLIREDINIDDDVQFTDIAELQGYSENTPSVQIGFLVGGICQLVVLDHLGDVHVNFHELYFNSQMLKDIDFKKLCKNLDLHFTTLPEELQYFLSLVIIPDNSVLTTNHWIPLSTICHKCSSYLHQNTELHTSSPSQPSDIVIKIAQGDYKVRFPTVEEEDSVAEQYVDTTNYSKMKGCDQDEDVFKLAALLLEREVSGTCSISNLTPIKHSFLKALPEADSVAEIQKEIKKTKESDKKELGVSDVIITPSCSYITFDIESDTDCVEQSISVPSHYDNALVKPLLPRDDLHEMQNLVKSSTAAVQNSMVSEADICKKQQDKAMNAAFPAELSRLIAVLPGIPCEDFDFAACSIEFDGLLASFHKFEAFAIKNDSIGQDISQLKGSKEHDIPEQEYREQSLSALQQQCKDVRLFSPSTHEKLPAATNVTSSSSTTKASVSPSSADMSSGKPFKVSLALCGVCKNYCSCLDEKDELHLAQDLSGEVQLSLSATVPSLPPAGQNQSTDVSRRKVSMQTTSEAPSSNACGPTADGVIFSGSITPSQQPSRSIGNHNIKKEFSSTLATNKSVCRKRKVHGHFSEVKCKQGRKEQSAWASNVCESQDSKVKTSSVSYEVKPSSDEIKHVTQYTSEDSSCSKSGSIHLSENSLLASRPIRNGNFCTEESFIEKKSATEQSVGDQRNKRKVDELSKKAHDKRGPAKVGATQDKHKVLDKHADKKIVGRSTHGTESQSVVDKYAALSKHLQKQTVTQMPSKKLDKSAEETTKDLNQMPHRTILKRVSSKSWKVVSQTSETGGPNEARGPDLASDIHLVKKLLLKHLEVKLEKNSQQDLHFRIRPRSSFREVLKKAGLTWNHPHCHNIVSKVIPLLVAAVRQEPQQILDHDMGNA